MLVTDELSADSQAKLEEWMASGEEFFALIDRLTGDSETLKQQAASLEIRLAAAEKKLATH